MAKFKSVPKSPPKQTKKDVNEDDAPRSSSRTTDIYYFRSHLESMADALESVFDLTGLAEEVEPEQHRAVIDGASYFIDVIKRELLRMHKHLGESIERSKAGGAA
jgi:hypothetical protein